MRSVRSGQLFTLNLHYITCHLADAFIQSDLQLIRLGRRHTPWSNVGLRALLKGPTAVQILSWPHLGSNHRPCGSKPSSLTATLQASLNNASRVCYKALWVSENVLKKGFNRRKNTFLTNYPRKECLVHASHTACVVCRM